MNPHALGDALGFSLGIVEESQIYILLMAPTMIEDGPVVIHFLEDDASRSRFSYTRFINICLTRRGSTIGPTMLGYSLPAG